MTLNDHIVKVELELESYRSNYLLLINNFVLISLRSRACRKNTAIFRSIFLFLFCVIFFFIEAMIWVNDLC